MAVTVEKRHDQVSELAHNQLISLLSAVLPTVPLKTYIILEFKAADM